MPEVCPVLGIPLFVRDGKVGPNSPSLDKIVPELGYVTGNVKVISNLANNIKQDVTDPQVLRRVADYVEAHQPKQ